jgi:APA family basic amino acid/polyamine antiporter
MHSFSLKYGASVQNVITVVKVGIIVVLIVAGLLLEGQVPPQNISLMPTDSDWDLIFSASFAQGLISVFYAYLGWNAAVYIMGEVKDAHVTVPKALLMGTGVVIVLYLLLNYTILYRVPLSELAGAEGDVAGKVAAQNIFGDIGAKLLTIFIAFALVSSASSMIIAGPRVTQMMGQDYPIYSLMGKTNKAGVPVYAILLQSIVTIGLIVSTSYFFLLQYIGFTLSIFSLLTVVGVYIARIKEGAPAEGLYRVPGYPFTPAIFLLISGWMVVRALMGSVEVALAGIGTFALGITLYYFSAKATKA